MLLACVISSLFAWLLLKASMITIRDKQYMIRGRIISKTANPIHYWFSTAICTLAGIGFLLGAGFSIVELVIRR